MCDHVDDTSEISTNYPHRRLTYDRLDQVFTVRTPRIIAARKLLKAAGRRKEKKFLVEGFNGVEGALSAGVAREVLVADATWEKFSTLIELGREERIPVSLIDDKAASALSETVSDSGVFATCQLLSTSVESCIKRARRGRGLVAVGIDMSDPGNAGTFIRTADAVGADCVVFLGNSVDIHNGKTVRSAAGSVFRIPIGRERDIKSSLDDLSSAGFQIVATTIDGETSLDEAADEAAQWRIQRARTAEDMGELEDVGAGLPQMDAKPPMMTHPSAWLFGNEAHGLSPDIADFADVRVRIPIRGNAESFNVAGAAAITLYEASRALSSSQRIDRL